MSDKALLAGRRPKTAAALAAAVLAATVLSACSSSTTNNVNTLTMPKLGAVGTPTSWLQENNSLPLAGYTFTDAEDADIVDAIRITTVSCVRKQGFGLYDGSNISGGDVSLTIQESEGDGGSYGYIDQANAAARGFQSIVVDARPPGSAAAMSTAETAAAKTCQSAADAELPFVPSAQQLVAQLETTAESVTDSDPRVVTATKAWSTCMQSQGYSTTDPGALAHGYRLQLAAGTVPAAEIQAALADVTCTRQTNLSGVYFAVEAGYQRELISQNSVALADLAKANQAELQTVNSIVGSGR